MANNKSKHNHLLRTILRVLVPILVLAAAIVAANWIADNPPSAQKHNKRPDNAILVEVSELMPVSYEVRVDSYGTVQPRSQGALVSQVAGSVTRVAESFAAGGFFEKGEVLLEIDNRDYVSAKRIAEAELTQARLALAEEQARAAQAKKDWQRLGKGNKANELVLRKPQLAAAQGTVKSAKAKLEQAKLDLARTVIRAPYAGRVLDKQVDIGQFVNKGGSLASIYAVDYLEVRLPLSTQQQDVVKLPEMFRRNHNDITLPDVSISMTSGRKNWHWQGHLIRTEGALDPASRQLFAIARIDDPYGESNSHKPPLKIGQFVSASIQGRMLEKVFVVPRSTLHQGDQVILYKEGILQRRTVSVLWSDSASFIIGTGLNPGEYLVTTPLGNVISGTKARLVKEKP